MIAVASLTIVAVVSPYNILIFYIEFNINKYNIDI